MDVHWIALTLLRKVGAKTISALIEEFGTAQAIIQADTEALLQVRGIGQKTAGAIIEIDLPHITQQIQKWQTNGVMIYPSNAEGYPIALKKLDDAPPTLFVRGRWPLPAKAVAIVGTRQPSNDARDIAFKLGKCLAEQGWIIVSGLAHGIDSAAHEGALSVADGRTIAVLGSGVLNIYPEKNKALAQRILQNGAIISENHPYAPPNAPRLVSRNRIISGLCQHIIVVETSSDGGAMYAAKAALTQGRTLHAVELPASGNQELLRNQAKYINPDIDTFTLD